MPRRDGTEIKAVVASQEGTLLSCVTSVLNGHFALSCFKESVTGRDAALGPRGLVSGSLCM